MKLCLFTDLGKDANADDKNQARLMVSSEQVLDALRSFSVWLAHQVDDCRSGDDEGTLVKQQTFEDVYAVLIDSFDEHDVGWVLRLL